jgi:hypothetical protein
VRFHLGEIEVRTLTTLDELLGIVEEVKGEIKDGSRAGLTVNEDVLLNHVPTSRSILGKSKIN